MFSEIHTGSVAAVLRTRASTGTEAEFFVGLPWDARVSIVPTTANMRSAAMEILHARWIGVGRRAFPYQHPDGTQAALVLSGVTLRYARADFDRRTGTHIALVLRAVDIPATSITAP
jgi:hypothetical protein